MKGKRQYRIARTDLGYKICKRKEKENWTMECWFLWPNNNRVLEPKYAKTFYSEDDAKGNLVIIKLKDGKETD